MGERARESRDARSESLMNLNHFKLRGQSLRLSDFVLIIRLIACDRGEACRLVHRVGDDADCAQTVDASAEAPQPAPEPGAQVSGKPPRCSWGGLTLGCKLRVPIWHCAPSLSSKYPLVSPDGPPGEA